MLFQDIRYALRMLAHRPVFAGAVVVTLALGIGANTLIYSVVDAVVLRPFDFPDPDRILAIGVEFPRLGQDLTFFEAMSAHELRDIEEQSRTLEAIVGFDMGNRQIMGSEAPQNLLTAFWWGDPLVAAGLTPLAGRSFQDRDIDDREAVAMISERIWAGRYDRDPAMIGSTILINDDPHTLIGVFPEAADFYGTDLWTPMWASRDALPRNRRQINVLARAAEGVTLTEVNTELDTIARRTEQEYGGEFEEYEGWSLRAYTWTDANVRTLRPVALILLGAVGFVLLLVCANVASLLLSRSTSRQREIAVRAALGAGGRRIFRQLMSESLVIAGLGAAAGVLLAWLGLQWFAANIPANILPTTRPLTINGGVLLYAVGISVLAGVLFGLAPAWQTSRVDLQGTLQAGGGGAVGSARRRRMQHTLVGVEVALALILLTTSGIFVTSITRIQAVDPGFDADDVLTMRLTLPWSRYQGQGITDFFEELSTRVENIPGVRAATTMSQYPPIGFSSRRFSLPERPVAEGESLPVALVTLVAHDATEVLGVPLRLGRTFGPQDTIEAPPVALINETFARRLFPEGNAIGRRIRMGAPEEAEEMPAFEIIGVVGDTRNSGLDSPPRPELYASYVQAGGAFNQLFLLVRTETDPRGVLPTIREQVAALDPDQPIYNVATLREAMARPYAVQGFSMVLLGAFALIALVLAAVGIFAIVAYAVAARSREIGLRMALGADQGVVQRLVVRQAMLPVLLGGLIGMVGSVALSGVVTSVLSEVDGIEPVPLLSVAAILMIVAAAASYLPARRASRIDPVNALRSE